MIILSRKYEIIKMMHIDQCSKGNRVLIKRMMKTSMGCVTDMNDQFGLYE